MKKNRTVNMYTPEGARLISSKEAMAMPWNVYPRPHLKRDSFLCLNGEWEFCVCESQDDIVEYSEKITVPFVPQSILSGIGRDMPEKSILFYKKEFVIPQDFLHGKAILHFGAVDQIIKVKFNGHILGEHRGGYDGFSFDITPYLKEKNIIEAAVRDELENKILPYGKQKKKRGGMWYTPVSGIWQTVWIESVPENFIKELKIVTDKNGADIFVECSSSEKQVDGRVTLYDASGEKAFALEDGHARIDIDLPILWSPESPHIYDISVSVGEDTVLSYLAIRTLEISEVNGKRRLCLNGEPYFFHGLLDQGYFSDGIFLPADPSGYERDILEAKELGFNMLRKHIKVEPEIFYYLCDKLGMIVFQDMVNNSDYSFLRDTALPTAGIKRIGDKHLHRNKKSRKAFVECMEKTVQKLCFHPCVCYWTIFNEGWGQFDHASAYEKLRSMDSSRFIDSVSGWFYPLRSSKLKSDVYSLHVYFVPVKIGKNTVKKPVVLSEFGGYAYKIDGHSFNLDKDYGYRTFKNQDQFESALEELYNDEIVKAVENGLCASVYTQISDVEDEINGLMTYDRKVTKVSYDVMNKIAKKLFDACK